MSRGGFKIQLETQRGVTYEKPSSTPSWMREFASKAQSFIDADSARQKSAVTAVTVNNDSIYDRMYSIMNGSKPLYSSVEEAVSDYQSKTGLVQYLDIIHAQEGNHIKSAAEEILSISFDDDSEKKKIEPDDIELFKIIPEAKDYIDNIVKNNPSLSIPAILTTLTESLGSLGISSGIWDAPELAEYINGLLGNIEYDTNDLRYIGNIDDTSHSGNTEALEILRKTVR